MVLNRGNNYEIKIFFYVPPVTPLDLKDVVKVP